MIYGGRESDLEIFPVAVDTVKKQLAWYYGIFDFILRKARSLLNIWKTCLGLFY